MLSCSLLLHVHRATSSTHADICSCNSGMPDFASKMTYIVSGGALNSTHSLTPGCRTVGRNHRSACRQHIHEDASCGSQSVAANELYNKINWVHIKYSKVVEFTWWTSVVDKALLISTFVYSWSWLTLLHCLLKQLGIIRLSLLVNLHILTFFCIVIHSALKDQNFVVAVYIR